MKYVWIVGILLVVGVTPALNAQVSSSQLMGIGAELDRNETSEYLLKITRYESESETEVRIEITYSGIKEIFVGKTPFEYKFYAGEYYVYYESLNPESLLVAQLSSDRYNRFHDVPLLLGNGTEGWTTEASRKGIFFSSHFSNPFSNRGEKEL